MFSFFYLNLTSELTTKRFKHFEEDELKLVGQLSDRCSKYHPALPSLLTKKRNPTGSMGMVIQDEGCFLQASLSLKHS